MFCQFKKNFVYKYGNRKFWVAVIVPYKYLIDFSMGSSIFYALQYFLRQRTFPMHNQQDPKIQTQIYYIHICCTLIESLFIYMDSKIIWIWGNHK
ncbi:hypothetical protein BpHYR1_006104 [Brachionus plicatilis]|uniref:Uncharacterized protein n=1 Tax=Brachionus plicatilis TaxID=10195 RepID=A0A3M7QZR0_BRAPC|nr:hypothetical protein BpHYR1_006104 [Brachionus plicatilis]